MDQDPVQSVNNTNTVITHNDYIEVIWEGPQNSEKVHQSNVETLKAVEIIQSKHKPLLLLLRIYNHPLAPNMEAFQEVLKIFQAITFNKVAISGTVSPQMETLIASVVSSINEEVELAYIAEPEEALAWLRSN
jgi:hypothetical protein